MIETNESYQYLCIGLILGIAIATSVSLLFSPIQARQTSNDNISHPHSRKTNVKKWTITEIIPTLSMHDFPTTGIYTKCSCIQHGYILLTDGTYIGMKNIVWWRWCWIGTASFWQIIHSVVSRLYPSIQRLHMGPLVPCKHPSVILSEVLLVPSGTPMQSFVYGHLSKVMLQKQKHCIFYMLH